MVKAAVQGSDADCFENPIVFDNPIVGGPGNESPDRTPVSIDAGYTAFEVAEDDAASSSPVDQGDGGASGGAVEPILPESLAPRDVDGDLEALEDEGQASQLEAWKLSLVEKTVAVLGGQKENERDRRRRQSEAALSASSLVDPVGRFRRRWDLAQMLALVYVAFGVPYRLGFGHPVLLWSGWFWFDLVIDLYFIADIFVSMRTAFHTRQGELVVDAGIIRRTYLKTWFPIDVAACFPGQYISYAVDDGGGSGSKLIKLLRMLRLLKLLRLARINRLIQRYQ
jgi:hypothetical protein